MLGVPLVAADTDAHAEFLATTTKQRILALIRGQSLLMRPPVQSMQGLWRPHEEQAVNEFLSMAMVGSAETIAQKVGDNRVVNVAQNFLQRLRIGVSSHTNGFRLSCCDV